jgi:hypothetical protein
MAIIPEEILAGIWPGEILTPLNPARASEEFLDNLFWYDPRCHSPTLPARDEKHEKDKNPWA